MIPWREQVRMLGRGACYVLWMPLFPVWAKAVVYAADGALLYGTIVRHDSPSWLFWFLWFIVLVLLTAAAVRSGDRAD